MNRLNFFWVVILLATLTPFVSTAQSVTFIVTDANDDSNARDSNPGDGICSDANNRCTLRAAIDEANASDGLDVTVVIPGLLPGSVSGNFTLSRVAPNNAFNTYENDNVYGDLDINGSFNTLRLQGTGTPGPTISISPNDRIIDIISGGKVFIERIHFTGGTARAGRNGNSDNSNTFGIDGENGEDGGGMRIGNGMDVEMDQVTFNGNVTQSGGNGAPPASSIDLIDGGDGGSGGSGGALYISTNATVSISRGTFTQNGTGDGGSPASGQSNGEPAEGGRGGNGGNGGAIYNAGSLELISCTIAFNNGGDPTSGAAGVNGGETGEEGEGGSGGGIAQARFIDGEEVVQGNTSLLNNIIAGNTAGDDTQDGAQPGTDFYDSKGGKRFTSQGYNLVGTKNASGAFRTTTGDEIGSGETGINPRLNGLNQNDDEAVPTLQPRSNSPAVNTGTTVRTPDYDARGFVRPNGQQADKGAHERNSVPTPVELVISSFTADGSDQEAITITNNGDYAAQADDHVLVAFGDDYADNGTSCLSVNLYGEIQPGGSFTVGDMAVSPKQHLLTFDTRGPSCEAGAANQLSDVTGAIGLYTGGAVSLQGFAFGSEEEVRLDLVEYGNTARLTGTSAVQTGVRTLQNPTSLTVFPNPASGTAQLRFIADQVGTYEVRILDLTGKLLKSYRYDSEGEGTWQAVQMDLDDLVNGVYLIHVIQGADRQVSRFILQ